MTNILPQIHDRLFGSSMTDIRVARDFFRQHLPAKVREAVDFDSLTLCPKTYVDEKLKLTQSDVLYQAKIAGETGYLYCLVEAQSTVDPLMPYRLLQYNLGIWANHIKQNGGKVKKLPVIANLLFYNGRCSYTGPRDFRELLDASPELVDELWNKPFTLINVHDVPDEAVREHLWSGMLAFFMKNAWRQDFLAKFSGVTGELAVLERQGGGKFIISLLEYGLINVDKSDEKTFVEIVKEGLSADIGEKIMTTVAEHYISQGISQGMAQGIARGRNEGRAEGEHHILLRQLKRKFSLVPERYLEKMAGADEDELLTWSERVLFASSIDEVFAE